MKIIVELKLSRKLLFLQNQIHPPQVASKQSGQQPWHPLRSWWGNPARNTLKSFNDRLRKWIGQEVVQLYTHFVPAHRQRPPAPIISLTNLRDVSYEQAQTIDDTAQNSNNIEIADNAMVNWDEVEIVEESTHNSDEIQLVEGPKETEQNSIPSGKKYHCKKASYTTTPVACG